MLKNWRIVLLLGLVVSFAVWIQWWAASDFLLEHDICEVAKPPQDCESHNILFYSAWSIGRAFDHWSALITAIATGAIGFFTLTLKRSTDRLWKTGERAFEGTERAFVHLDGFNFEMTTKKDMKETEVLTAEPEWHRTHPGLVLRRFNLQPRWKNSGNTPTKNMRIQIDWRPPIYAVEVPEFTYRGQPQPFFVPPGAVEPSFVIDMPWAQAIIEASWDPSKFQPLILIWGRADYEDIFGGKHFVEWCHRLRLSRSGGQKLSASTIQWGDYNRTDADKQD